MVLITIARNPASASKPPSSRPNVKQDSEKKSIAKQPPTSDFKWSVCTDKGVEEFNAQVEKAYLDMRAS